MAKIKIKNIASLKNGRFELYCNETESGDIKIGDYIRIPVKKSDAYFQISEFYEQDNQIKLIVSGRNNINLGDLKLIGKEVEIGHPIRGVDVQMAGSYGIGVKWWAGLVLLGVLSLILWLLFKP